MQFDREKKENNNDEKYSVEVEIRPKKRIVFPHEISSEFYLELISTAASNGYWIDKNIIESIYASLTVINNLNSFEEVVDSNLFAALLVATEDKSIQLKCSKIIKMCAPINVEKWVDASFFLICNGMETEKVKIICYGLELLHIIISQSSSLPPFCLNEEFPERMSALLQGRNPSLVANVLLVYSDILMNGGSYEMVDFKRVTALATIDNVKVQYNSLCLMFIILTQMPIVEKPLSLMNILSDIVERGSFDSKVAALKCFSLIFDLRKEEAIQMIGDKMLDSIVFLLSASDDSGTTSMSFLIKVMRAYEREQIEGLYDILTCENVVEALENIIDSGSSILSEHAKLLLDFIDELENTE